MIKTILFITMLTSVSFGNIIGKVTYTLAPEKTYYFSMPFDEVNFDLRDQLPHDTLIGSFNRGKYEYVESYDETTIQRGIGFFIKLPDNSEPISFTIFGTVPREPMTMDIAQRFSLVGYPYPILINLTNTTLSTLPEQFTIKAWDIDNQTWKTIRKKKNEWTAHTFNIGEGFWVLTRDSFEWKEELPYVLE